MAKKQYLTIQQYTVLVVCFGLFLYGLQHMCGCVRIFWAGCEFDQVKDISAQQGAPEHSPANPSIAAFAILSKFNFFICDEISQFKADNITQ